MDVQKNKSMKLLLTIFLFLLAVISNATTYYVRTDGNNANAGTTNSSGGAWLTIAYASTHTSSGDIIHVVAGTFLETTQIAIPVGVSIEGDGVTSIIQNTYDDGSGFNLGAGMTLVSGSNTNGNQHISNVLFDGRSLSQDFALDIKGRNNIEIYNCTFQNFFQAGVIMTGQVNNSFGAPSVYATGLSFHDNIMNNCSRCDGTTGFGNFMFGGTDGMLIYNNTITQNQRTAQTNGWPIKGWCESYIYNTQIHDNILTTQQVPAGKINGQDGFWDFAIELFFSYGGNQIYNNTMTGSIDMNWQFRLSQAYSWYIHNNTIGFSSFPVGRQSGIICEFDTESIIIDSNTIRNVADGIIFSMRPSGRLRNIKIGYNLIYNVGSVAGGYGYGIGYFDNGSANWTGDTINIINNTVVATTNTSYAPFYGINFGDASSINKFVFKDNIVQGFQDGDLITNTPSAWASSFVQYNDFYLNAHSNVPFTTFSGTNTPSGCTVSLNLLGTDPLFGGSTYDSLQTGSPCRLTASDGTNIGYWQTGSPAPPPTPTNGFQIRGRRIRFIR